VPDDPSYAAKYVRLSSVTYPDGREVYYNYSGDEIDDALSRLSDIADGTGQNRVKYGNMGTLPRNMGTLPQLPKRADGRYPEIGVASPDFQIFRQRHGGALVNSLCVVICAVVLFVVGIVCLLFPLKIQAYAIRNIDKGWTPRIALLNNFVRSKSYLVNVRLVGVLALLASGFILWAIIMARCRVG